MGYKMTTWIVPRWTVWLLSLVDPEVTSIYTEVDRVYLHDNSRSRQILKLDYVPVNQTLIDVVHSMIKHGLVPKLSGCHNNKPAVSGNDHF
jgi:hypothetical protein